MRHLFSYLPRTQKILVYPETWLAYIECRDVSAKILLQFFIIKCFFSMAREYAHHTSEVDFQTTLSPSDS
jgi:hypothetical protein